MRIALLVNNVPKEMLTIAETLHQKLVEDGTFLVGFDIVGASCWRSVYTRRASDHW
ncbi:hypothetical protein [Ensifer sp. 22564]|uniref:hypothetical protein n=1 Tax=unclassified Ensifer TaxID=2633371 RepID=UPI003F850860